MNAVSAGEADPKDENRGATVMREHGATVARVCMALLGDPSAAERALERIAKEAGTTVFEVGHDALARLMGLARVACSNQLSKLPIRTAPIGIGVEKSGARSAENDESWGVGGKEEPKPATTRDRAREPALARGAIGKLKPTEREAVVLHLVGGLSAAQVADACGVDLETARQRIARGVAQLVEPGARSAEGEHSKSWGKKEQEKKR
jgi:DNA-directed RNA polymerase specialized sigma24 family protein